MSGKATGLGVYNDAEIHMVAGGVWSKFGTETLATGLNTEAEWRFCNFQGNFPQLNLLAVNGIDVPRKYNGSTVSTWANVPSGGMKYIDAHDRRIYGVIGNFVHYSSLNKAEDWVDPDVYVGAGAMSVDTPDGEDINGIAAGNRHLMVFKPSSFHELWGTAPYNYQMETIATDIGLLNQKCVTVMGDMPFWMDRNGVYQYGGSRPRDISLPVKDYIRAINPALSRYASAGSDGSHLYFSIPTSASPYPDMTLEYHKDFQIWTVWRDVSPLAYANYANGMYFANYNSGSNTTTIATKGGTTDFGNAIAWEWVSPPFGGGSLAQKLRWYRLWYVADVPVGSTLNVYVSPSAEGDTDWKLVKAVNGASGKQTARVIVPIDQLANANWLRVRFTGTGPATVHELDYQQREMPMY